MYESGQFNKIKKKWEVLQPKCIPILRRGNPLSFSKLISLFAIIVIGILSALFVMVFEYLSKPKKEAVENDSDVNLENLKFMVNVVNLCFENDETPSKHLLISLSNASLNVTSR